MRNTVLMDYDLGFSGPPGELTSRVELISSPWRHLLRDARLEQDARRTRRQRHRHIPPEPR